MTQVTEGILNTPVGSLTAEQASADAPLDLRTIGDLAGLVAGSRGLPELLAEVSTFAARAIPGADGAGETLLQVDRLDNMVEALAASAPFVAEIDEIQYVTLIAFAVRAVAHKGLLAPALNTFVSPPTYIVPLVAAQAGRQHRGERARSFGEGEVLPWTSTALPTR